MNSLDMNVVTMLLRAPSTIADSIRRGAMLRSIAAASIASIVLGMGVYGGIVGSVRGGLQIVFAAAKMPLVALVTLSLLAPFVAATARSFSLETSFPRATALILAATARAALVLLALAPTVAMLITLTSGYHDRVLIATAGFALAGLAGLPLLWYGIPEGTGKPFLAVLVLIGYGIVSMQSAWVLRPWITRPRSAITFLRAPEGAVAEEVLRATRSANGHYDRAPTDWEGGR